MDKKINKILACIDLSEYSLITLEYALEFAKKTGARIVGLNVINQRDINGVDMANGYFPGYYINECDTQEYVMKLTEERHEGLKQLIKENFAHDASIMEIKINGGIPSECILNTIEAEEIDLVVMANKGRGNISRFLFGSVAEKVFRHSPVPVVSVRDKLIFKR